MKINNKNSFASKIVMLMILVFSNISSSKTNNKFSKSPDTTEPISSTKAKLPKLSDAFNSINQKHTLKRELFFNKLRYTTYKLSRGELEQIFNFIDREKKDEITFSQWEEFKTLFILPFENCDHSKDNLLTEKEFSFCSRSDPRYRFITFRRRHNKDLFKKIIEILGNDASHSMNFANYLFFRKAINAFRMCQSHEKYISVSSFNCAMNKIYKSNKFPALKYYRVALKYQYNDNSLIAPDFLCYLNIANMYNYFRTFSYPNKNLILEKNNFIKAIKEDRLPNNFEISDIEYFFHATGLNFENNYYKDGYNLVNGMNFETFCFFFHYNKLFNRYSREKPSKLSQNELMKLIEDKSFSKVVKNAIDYSFINLSKKDHMLALKIQDDKNPSNGPGENLRFKEIESEENSQDHSSYAASINDKKTINSEYYEKVKKNAGNRKIFFTIFRNAGKHFWTKRNYYWAMLKSNLFVSHSQDRYHYRIPVNYINKNYNIFYLGVNPPLSIKNKVNFKIYEMIPFDERLDFLTFMAIENFQIKFDTVKNDSLRINDVDLRMIMKDFGIENVPNGVLRSNFGSNGFDSVNRRQYKFLDAAKKLFVNQAATSEIKSDRLFIKENDLNVRYDPLRKTPHKEHAKKEISFVR